MILILKNIQFKREKIVLRNILKKEKPRVYLGALAVVARTGIKKNFDSWDFSGSLELDGKLKESLIEIFCFPLSSSIHEALENDLVVDVLISEFQLGAALISDIPIFWRPKITLVSKLSYLKSGKTKKLLSVTVKMPWAEFVSRLLTLQGITQFKPAFNSNDLEKLLHIASYKVLTKIKNSM